MLELNGRLGNQLWQIAATAQFARQNGGRVALKPSWEYREFFNFPDLFFQPVPPEGTRVDGETNYFQEYPLIQDVAQDLREWLIPSPMAQEEVMKLFPEFWKLPFEHRTAIHIRRGDYLKYPRHFPIVTPEYLRRSTEYVLNQNPQTTFYVFSDDPTWCHSFFDSTYRIIEGVVRPVEISHRRGRPQDQWDLFAMSLCDQHIISNSTFSYWGAWMSQNKSPLYPSAWFGPELRQVPWELAIPEGWMKIEC